MGSLYRSWAILASLVSLSIILHILGISLEGNFLIGNHLADSILVLGIISLLSDLDLLPKRYRDNLFAIGVIALLAGAVYETLSFGSFFTFSNTALILRQWFRVAPILIFAVALPVLMIANQVSREMRIWGFNSTGKNGLIFVSLFSMAYTIAAIYFLIKVFSD